MIDAFSVFTDFEPFYSSPEPPNPFAITFSSSHLSIVSFRQHLRAAYDSANTKLQSPLLTQETFQIHDSSSLNNMVVVDSPYFQKEDKIGVMVER